MDFPIVKSKAVSSGDLHFYRTPAAVVYHEQSILDRAGTGSEIKLLHQTAQVDVLNWVVVVEIDVLAWQTLVMGILDLREIRGWRKGYMKQAGEIQYLRNAASGSGQRHRGR